MIAATLGCRRSLRSFRPFYAALKLAGGAYLVWLGIPDDPDPHGGGTDTDLPKRSRRRAFLDSVIVEVLNPKVAVFFIAFLPQFVDGNAALPVWGQFLILGTIVNLTFSSADVFTVLFASQVQKQLRRSSRWQDVSRWITDRSWWDSGSNWQRSVADPWTFPFFPRSTKNARPGGQRSSSPTWRAANNGWSGKAPIFRPTRCTKTWQSGFRSGKSGMIETESGNMFLTVSVPPPRLVIIGAVHISQALAPMAEIAGFDVTIIDPRTAFATEERFPAETLIAEWPEDVLKDTPFDTFTAVAAVTHDPKIDGPARCRKL